MGHKDIYAYDHPQAANPPTVKQSVVWGGRRWWLNGGYYCNRRGALLHRAVYASAYGPIPEGVDIHHKDGDKTNNAVENLESVTRSEHLRKHRPRGWTARGTAELRRAAYEQWAHREAYERHCDQCGKAYVTTGTRSRFCSPNCNAQYGRKHRIYSKSSPTQERQCAFCGGPFRTYSASRKYCSSACFYETRTKPERACVVCGKLFRTQDPRTICCSRACGYVYRRKR